VIFGVKCVQPRALDVVAIIINVNNRLTKKRAPTQRVCYARHGGVVIACTYDVDFSECAMFPESLLQRRLRAVTQFYKNTR